MNDVAPPRYDRDGYRTAALLDADFVAALLDDADRLAHYAAGFTHSVGDFNLEADAGGYHGQSHRSHHPPVTPPRTPDTAGTSALGDRPRPEAVTSLSGVLRKVSNVVQYSHAAERAAAHADVTAAARDALGAASVQLAHSILWCKPLGVGSPKPPHQDARYLEGNPDRYVTIWIALDPATSANGCLRVTPGSHRFDLPHSGEEPQVTGPAWPGADVVDVPLEPGHAIVFHPRLLHGSGPNLSRHPRRALMLRYLDPTPSSTPSHTTDVSTPRPR